MAPKKVFVIRHCDKPSDKKGDRDHGGCNSDGYKRANLLAGFSPDTKCDGVTSCNNKCPVIYDHDNSTPYWSQVLLGGKPTKLLAPLSKNDNKNCTKSNRCCLILNPTAALYNLTINENNESFCDDQGADMAKYIKSSYSSDDIVIVAWEHKNIPELINGLGISPKLGKWPDGEKNDRFDLVFIIDFSNGTPDLTIDVQNLRAKLPGDFDNKNPGKLYDDPFGYNYNKKNNSLRTTQRYYDINTSKKNNHLKIIIIFGGIIVSIILICMLIYFIKKLFVKK